MTRWVLCLLLALMACTRKPTLEQLNAHPARQLETWGGVPKTPLEERIVHPIPETLLDYIRKDNIFQGYSEKPRPATVDAALLEDLRAAVRDLPAQVKELAGEKLIGITTIAELGGSAYSERIRKGDDHEAAAWVVIDASVLDRKANAWASWKENSPFVPDPAHRIEATIEKPENDTRKNALRYIILHELGHVISFGRNIHPRWWRPPKHAKTGKYKFFRMSWTTKDEEYVSLFDDVFPARREVHYYAAASKRLPASRAVAIYEGLQKTSFATLYGATNYQDDFAEAFVTYVHTQMQGRPYEVRMVAGDAVEHTYRACWGEKRCVEKRAFLEKLLLSP